jgi:hypothetical protein
MSAAKWVNFAKKSIQESAKGVRVAAPEFNTRVKGTNIWPRNTTSTPVLGSRVVGMIKSPNAPKSRKSRKSRKTRKSRK